MQIDLTATLRCWPVDVDLGGHTYTIPPLPATDWMTALLAGGWEAILPDMLDGDLDDLEDQLFDGTVTTDDLRRAAQDAVEAAAGTKWWSAERLAAAIAGSWLGGELVLQGVDPDRIPFGAYLSAAHQCVLGRMDKTQRVRWELDLDRPPAGVDPEEWYDEDAAAEGWMAAMRATGGR